MRELAVGTEGFGLRTINCGLNCSEAFSVHPAGNGYSGLFKAGEGEGGEEADTPSQLHLGFLTATAPHGHMLKGRPFL